MPVDDLVDITYFRSMGGSHQFLDLPIDGGSSLHWLEDPLGLGKPLGDRPRSAMAPGPP